MKKAAVLLLALLMLAGCTSQAYKSSMDLGREELNGNRYLEAYEAFKKAFKEEQTDEAEDLMKLSGYMYKAEEAYEKSDVETAISLLRKVLAYKTDDPEGNRLKKQAKEREEELESASKEQEELSVKLEEGKELLEQSEYEEAEDIFQQIAESDLPSGHDLKKEAVKLAEQAKQKKSESESGSVSGSASSNQQAQKPEKSTPDSSSGSSKGSSSKSGGPSGGASSSTNDSVKKSGPLTHEEGAKLVEKYLKINASSNLSIQYDHDDEEGNYIYQVYEMVIDNPDTKEGHTATWGWYGVNPKTKKVFDAL